MGKAGNSWVSDLAGALITARVAILLFCAVLAFFVTFPPVFLALLILGLVYSIYRIFKDRKPHVRTDWGEAKTQIGETSPHRLGAYRRRERHQ
jgi:hypothetical protein